MHWSPTQQAVAANSLQPLYTQGRMHRLLDALGDPQNAWTAVHVTGTKGKGSTGRMVADMLRAARYRVGLYARCARGSGWAMGVGGGNLRGECGG